MEESARLDVDRFGTARTELESRPPAHDVAEGVPRAVMVPAGPRAPFGTCAHHRRCTGFKGELTRHAGRDGARTEAFWRDHEYRAGHVRGFSEMPDLPAHERQSGAPATVAKKRKQVSQASTTAGSAEPRSGVWRGGGGGVVPVGRCSRLAVVEGPARVSGPDLESR